MMSILLLSRLNFLSQQIKGNCPIVPKILIAWGFLLKFFGMHRKKTNF